MSMKFLHEYRNSKGDGEYSVSGEQGSRFAKQVADDYNPIHHADSRRFCVPGDLLFAIALSEYGLCTSIKFRFLDLLGANVNLSYPPADTTTAGELEVCNERGKPTLGVSWSGENSRDERQIESLIRNYVAFSGQNFPHILVPLMREQQVMINPKRPLVIYESMALELNHLNFVDLSISLAKTTLEVAGKRGDAKLYFTLSHAGKEVGSGVKKLVLSGLREYQEDAIQAMCDDYAQSKLDYTGAL